jgi:hypothetical protein
MPLKRPLIQIEFGRPDSPPPPPPHAPGYPARVFYRVLIVLTIAALIAALTFAGLTQLQHWSRPVPPPNGWVIDPPRVTRYFAALFSPAFIGAPFSYLLSRRWKRQEVELGRPPVPPVNLPLYSTIALLIYIAFFGSLFVSAVVANVRAFTLISPAGIRIWRITRTVDYPYSDVRELLMIPSGYYVRNGDNRGPKLEIRLADGSSESLGDENGLSEASVGSIAEDIASRAGVTIFVHPNATPADRP